MTITKEIAKGRLKQLKRIHKAFRDKISEEERESDTFQRGIILGFAEGKIKLLEEVLRGGG